MRDRYSSVPRLAGAPPPEVDPAGRSYAVIALGAPARPVADAWTRRIVSRGSDVPVWSVRADRLDEALTSAFGEHLRGATVGWRLMLAGPEADVMRLRAQAIRAGAIPAEISEHVTVADRRRVRCAHCRTTTEAEVDIGGSMTCGGCGLTLVCYGHFSRRLAAYLGFEAT